MNLALFGGTGATGRAILERSGTRGVAVRALVRPQSSLGLGGRPTLTTVVGELDSPEAIDRTLEGCDAACIVFGPRPPYTDVFCALATRRIVAAMEERGIRRIVCQTGAMIGHYPENRTWPLEKMTHFYRWRHPGPYGDRVGQEAAVRDSKLDWTLIKPPRLAKAKASLSVECAPDLRVGLTNSVPRDDIADLILTALLQNRFMGQAVFVRKASWHIPVHAADRTLSISLDGLSGLPEESQARIAAQR